jgi:hypothetical protein
MLLHRGDFLVALGLRTQGVMFFALTLLRLRRSLALLIRRRRRCSFWLVLCAHSDSGS